MKILIASLVAALVPAAADAACFGSSSFSTCTDNSGNSYTVQRYGNVTTMNGFNSDTGSTWSQNSQKFGSSTYTNGHDADGNSWNMQQQRVGRTTIYSGTDSDGNYFSGTCGPFGCN